MTAAVLAIRGEGPKNRDWAAAKNMMKDVNKFIEDLKSLKGIIDSSSMPAKNVDGARPYLALEHVANLEIMKNLLDGEGPVGLRATIAMNASVAFQTCGKTKSLEEGLELTQTLISEGKVKKWVDKASSFFA